MAHIILPDIEGISARGWQSEDDWAVIARLLGANLKAIGVHLHVTPDEVKGWLANSDDIDRDNDYVFVDVAGETVAYTCTPTYMEHDGRRMYRHNCKVDPAWQGKGIGTALLDWVLAYNTERAITLGPGTLQTDVDNDDPAPTALFVAAGYEPVQHYAELVRADLENIPDTPLPDGLEARPVEESHLRAIYDSDYEAFQDHWGCRVRSDGDWKAFLDFAHRDETLWAVAWDGERVVSQVRGYVNVEENEVYNRKRGWAEFISTARDWRGKGVASALVCDTLRIFKERGLEEAALGVHVENPTGAVRLYQRLGFEVITTGAVYERPIAQG